MSIENKEIRLKELPLEVVDRVQYLVSLSFAHVTTIPKLSAFYMHQARSLALQYNHGTVLSHLASFHARLLIVFCLSGLPLPIYIIFRHLLMLLP